MYAKLKTNLIGLAAALSFVVVGFSLGEAPGATQPDQVVGPGAGPGRARPGAGRPGHRPGRPPPRRPQAPPGHALRFLCGPAAAPGVLR